MTTEQAQTVAEIRERADGIKTAPIYTKVDTIDAIYDRETLLQIIDSQAAEVKRLAKECDELQEEISEMCQAEGVIW